MRLKIIAGNLAVVVVLGLVAYFSVSGQLRSGLTKTLEDDIGNDRVLFERSFKLAAMEFVDLVSERAATRQLRDVFGGLDEDSRRTRAFEAAETTTAWLADPARGLGGVDIVVVVDETGKAIARNGARNVMFGKQMLPVIPSLTRVLRDGQAIHDVWKEDQQNKYLQTAIAPIRADSGTILGALIVGYDLSNGVASREAKLLGRDIAFVLADRVYSGSLDGTAVKDLNTYLFGEEKATTQAALSGDAPVSRGWIGSFGGSEYSGLTARLPMAPSVPVAFVVLGNRTAQTEVVGATTVILILMVVCVMLTLAYNFMVANMIMRPIEDIEAGVLAVINGKTDLRLETKSKELGGIASLINQLLNVFTGTAEDNEDEQGRISVAPSAATSWNDAAFSDGAAGGGAAAAGGGATNADEPLDDPALSAKLAGEGEPAYETRVYSEYVAAKQAIGENVGSIPQDRFHQRLKGRADALAKKHGCRLVRFQVQTANGQVVLRPVLIR
jgi:hypothetical protein